MEMKHFFRIIILAVAGMLSLAACSKDESAIDTESYGIASQESLSQEIINHALTEAEIPCASASKNTDSPVVIINPSDIHLTDSNGVEVDLGDEVNAQLANLFSSMIAEVKASMK